MKHMRPNRVHQRGVTMVELLVTMVITLFLVTAAAYVYLGTRDTQRAVERNSANQETGVYALEFLGRDIANAGFYPTVAPPISANFPKMRRIDGYPPGQGIPVRNTDWISPSSGDNAYITGIFGCDGAKFNVATGTCGTTSSTAPDSLVINYFSSDTMDSAVVGTRRDCNGADAGNDASNAIRKLNDGTPATAVNANLPPQLPLFVSNRYAIDSTSAEVEGQDVQTKSLQCSGNGNTNGYQPLLLGVEDMQLTYGIYNSALTRAPDRFYTATEIQSLQALNVNGISISPWGRVVAVRVCLMTKSVGAAPKIADKSSALRKYIDCKDQEQTQSANDTSLRKRFVQVFAVQNNINQSY
ncbi:PilW family protein [Variovorax sp. HJSM1_2]|uniref:PilW family protein n=1 Tax=Variovorax sp. HJSM1_2 TaxID=3366263 RepID=UPI003BE1F30D